MTINPTYVLAGGLIASLVLMPAASFAKEKEQIRAEANAEARGKAFGHLIAPGWLKREATASTSAAASTSVALPLGIWKHLDEDERAPGATPDTAAPSVFLVNARVSKNAAYIVWATNERADGQVSYGSTSSYGSTTPAHAKLSFFHAAKIGGLTASTTYHFKLLSKDAAGNLGSSGDLVFTTKP